MARFTATKPGAIEREGYEWYIGTYVGYELEEGGQFGDQIKWLIDFDGEEDNEGNQRTTWIYTGQNLTNLSKFGALVKGWTGQEVEPGLEFDPDDLEPGLRVKVMWADEPKANSGLSAKRFALAE